MNLPPNPARLHVLLACDKTLGVMMRRGPSNKFCTLLWDLRSDAFEMGQWVNARLYPMRSDLSPDGRFLIYFALNARWKSETRGSYTAVSRAPYLKAIALYPKGDAWGGGGLWTGRRTFWLNHCNPNEKPLRSDRDVQRDGTLDRQGGFGECPDIYRHRLARDGWIMEAGRDPSSVIAEFKKPLGSWILRKTLFFDSAYRCRYALVHEGTGTRHDCADWEWAELRGETILYAALGCLYRAKVNLRDGVRSRLVRDFNGMKFEPIMAPY